MSGRLDVESICAGVVSNYNDVRDALGVQLKSFQSGLTIHHFVPRSITPPAAIVQANPTRTIDYLQAQSSRSADWHFGIMIVVGLVNEKVAQKRVGDLISPGSELLRALNTRIANGYAQVTNASIQEAMFETLAGRQALHTYARLSVIVSA